MSSSLAVLLFFHLISLGMFEIQQSFRVQPRNVKIVEGGEALMECAISHLAGRVQWVMDGFALGFSAKIPGYPRYSVVGNASLGEFNLKIQNVSLDDDAQFQCQVTPFRSHKAIRASANLTVIAPPTTITMMNQENNSKFEVHENQDIALECIAKGSKPETLIVWYRGKDQLKIDKKEEKVENEKKRWSSWSRIRLTPTAKDDGATYACEAKHEALPMNRRFRATVQLSVLYPPGMPFIEGYTKGESISRGQIVELTCRSKGGNPPAQLVWYKNGEQVSMEYRTSGNSSENRFTFTATEGDDKAVYMCEASNVMSPTPLKTQVQLSVHYPPSHLTITGASEAKLGNRVPLTCSTAASNPATDIKWDITGQQIQNVTQKSVPAPGGGWITTSNVTVLIDTKTNKSIVIICHGQNSKINENLSSTHTITILNPPGKPRISGYAEGTPVTAGSVLKLTCTTEGGNPLPTMSWFKDDRIVHSTTNKMSEQTTVSEVAILINASDNEAIYRCEANNSAIEEPTSDSVTLSVYFPPSHVHIKQEPKVSKSGTKAVLTCESGVSNPPAELSWWKNDVPVTEGVKKSEETFKMYGGIAASVQLSVDVSTESDKDKYTCQATNPAVKRSVHSSHTLEVVYKPVFLETEKERKGLEGESLSVVLKTRSYPDVVTYTWTKNGSPVNSSFVDGPAINFEKLNRKDEGIYTCEAMNNEGSAFFSFHLKVQYPANIVSVSDNIEAGHGENVSLKCTLEGSPLEAEHVTWKRRGLSINNHSVKTFINNTSILTIHNVSKDDYGEYQCIVDNGLGNSVQKSIHLYIKHKPEIEFSPQIMKAASSIGSTAHLLCYASAAPKPRFTWNREGSPLAINTTEKYQVYFYQLAGTRYLSKLLIANVEQVDFGNYNCVVRNSLGYSSSIVKLTLPSAPDAPLNFTVLNFTQNAVVLSWLTGFDGGAPANFQIRYREAQSSSSVDSFHKVGPNISQTVINGLKSGTEYTFSIKAINKYGSSKYYSDTVKGVTLTPASPFSSSVGKLTADKSLLFIGLGFGSILLLLNAILLGFYLYKRSEKFSADKDKQSAGKTTPVEMYTSPSPYTGTGTTETLSSISEKSETFTDPNPDITNENRKIAASMCHMNQNGYSSHYPFLNWNHEYSFGTIRRNQHNIQQDMLSVESPYCQQMRLTVDPLCSYSAVSSNEIVDQQQPPLSLHYIVPPPPPPPPDVTVLNNLPQLSSFSFNNLSIDRHFM